MVAFVCIGLGITAYAATWIIMEYITAVKEERESDNDVSED